MMQEFKNYIILLLFIGFVLSTYGNASTNEELKDAQNELDKLQTQYESEVSEMDEKQTRELENKIEAAKNKSYWEGHKEGYYLGWEECSEYDNGDRDGGFAYEAP